MGLVEDSAMLIEGVSVENRASAAMNRVSSMKFLGGHMQLPIDCLQTVSLSASTVDSLCYEGDHRHFEEDC